MFQAVAALANYTGPIAPIHHALFHFDRHVEAEEVLLFVIFIFCLFFVGIGLRREEEEESNTLHHISVVACPCFLLSLSFLLVSFSLLTLSLTLSLSLSFSRFLSLYFRICGGFTRVSRVAGYLEEQTLPAD